MANQEQRDKEQVERAPAGSASAPGHAAASRERDCGVCGLPADYEIQITDDGYYVPRCEHHQDEPAYQAEVRLAEIIDLARRLERFPRAEPKAEASNSDQVQEQPT